MISGWNNAVDQHTHTTICDLDHAAGGHGLNANRCAECQTVGEPAS
jgi:hypothetical protein